MIVAVNGKALKTMEDLIADVESRTPGQSIDVTVLRKGKKKTLKVYLAEAPKGK